MSPDPGFIIPLGMTAELTSISEVVLQNPCQYPEAGARRLRPWIEELLGALAPDGSGLVVRFVSDREMRQLNRSFRQKDKTTDVLSFPGGMTADGHHLGDVVISVPVARRQASEARHSIDRELKVLILHGLLHCLGHDHETDNGEMERLEKRLRRRWITEP